MTDTTFRKTTLDNGLRVLTATMPHARSVAVSIYVAAGSRYETPEQAGLAHLIEHVCFKGTERHRTPQAISQAIDAVGGTINAATDRELTVFYCKVAQAHFELALGVLSDLVRRPLFASGELDKERRVILEELAMVADSPGQQVEVLLDETIWPAQALGRDVAGTEETVTHVTRDAVLDYLHHQYVPNNMIVSIAGPLGHKHVVERVAAALGDWPRGVPAGWFPAVNGQLAPRAAVQQRETEQAHLTLAVRALSLHHPDRYALSLLSVILGEGMGSRLALELRERRGLCYDVHSYTNYFQDAGSLVVYAGIDPSNTKEALGALLTELRRLRKRAVPDDELERAKELTKGRLLLRMEDTRAVSDWLGAQELLAGRLRTVDEVTQMIDAVTADDMRRVARELFVPKQLNLALVGPFRSERPFLRMLRR